MPNVDPRIFIYMLPAGIVLGLIIAAWRRRHPPDVQARFMSLLGNTIMVMFVILIGMILGIVLLLKVGANVYVIIGSIVLLIVSSGVLYILIRRRR